MKPRSAQQKGKRFENLINHEIESEGLGRATRTPGSGSGKLKGDSFNNLDFLLEIKNQKTIKIKEWIDQAREQARAGNYNANKWALIFRDPRTPETKPDIYVTIDLWEFLTLLKKDSEPRIKKPDNELKWHLISLKNAINRVVKDLK